ncbi:MAG: hypothetical protein KKB79_01885 [Nanoarchaeota archaeon]|nr:hypothetical protein [Nanoarchaeota archaeon]
MFEPEFFNLFGLPGFLILFLIGLSVRKKLKMQGWTIIVISLIGIVVDGYIVLTNFILN